MSTQDFLNLVLTIGFIVITICFVFLTYFFIQALRSINNMASDISDTTQSLREKVQLKALAAIPALLIALAGKVIRRRRG